MAEGPVVRLPRGAFNEKFYPLLREEACRYLVLYGGAGSGKSVFAAQRFLYRLMSLPLCNLLVVRAVAATHRDSTYALFRQVMARWGVQGLFTCRDSDLCIRCRNGNRVIFKGLDNAEKLKSVTFPKGELTDVWIEEASEVGEEDFNQLDVRLRGGSTHKQMVLTFNPTSALHWLKRRFFDREDPRAVVVKSTYRDNRFLDPDYKATLEGYRDSDPYYYSVYCLGEWGVLGNTFFHGEQVSRRLRELKGPLRRGEFLPQWGPDGLEEAGWLDSPGGPVQIYREPEAGHSYVIGADTAGEGSDYSVGQVVDLSTGAQACTLRARMDEDLFARQLFCLGRYYHWALLAVEANFSSYPIRVLEQLGYPRQYARPGEDAVTRRARERWGFVTTSANRPLILAGLAEVVRDHPEWLFDQDTLGEMLTFVRNRQGRPEAQSGAHDDCVMSLAIAHYCRAQALGGGRGPSFPALSVARGN